MRRPVMRPLAMLLAFAMLAATPAPPAAAQEGEAVTEGGASAVAAGAMFHFTEQTPLEAKKHLQASGVPVRL